MGGRYPAHLLAGFSLCWETNEFVRSKLLETVRKSGHIARIFADTIGPRIVVHHCAPLSLFFVGISILDFQFCLRS